MLTALFDEQDHVLFRPIETWTEAGRKRSRVDYRHTFCRMAKPNLLWLTVLQQLELAVKERLNLFFGVCPASVTRANSTWLGRFGLFAASGPTSITFPSTKPANESHRPICRLHRLW